MTNALTSLWGERTSAREQVTLTPPLIMDRVRVPWQRVGLDPSGAPEGWIWVPCGRCKGTMVHTVKGVSKPCKHCEAGGSWHVDYVQAEHTIRLPDDGLRYVWIDRTFVNPQYDALKSWLSHEGTGDGRLAWLIPVRTHRKWWRAWARTMDVVIYLDPFAFAGHCDKFMAPICLGYRGFDADVMVAAFADLGAPL